VSFSAEWLALRAEADIRARDPGLAARLSAHFDGRAHVRVLDLGSGTGAMMRAVAPLLGPDQRWLLVDSDPRLLAHAAPPPGVALDRVVADLAGELSPFFDPRPDLVTASAFFDLCAAAWIDRLVRHAAAAGAAVYAVLSYDGRESWAPPHSLDAAVLAAFHADQRRDKGLDAALGPDAAAHLADSLRRAGFEVGAAPSDWRLAPPADAALIRALARDSARAVAPALGRAAAGAWGRAREAAAAVTIGHTDILALPPRRS
jgi:SAM-dependent methyltransferase